MPIARPFCIWRLIFITLRIVLSHLANEEIGDSLKSAQGQLPNEQVAELGTIPGPFVFN